MRVHVLHRKQLSPWTRLDSPAMSPAACALTLAVRTPASQAGASAEPKGSVHPQLWQACAGSTCTVPPVGAAVYYFPQGHAEHAAAAAAADLRAPPFVPCRVAAVWFMAEPDTDEIFAKIRLVPLRPGEPVADAGDAQLVNDEAGQRQPWPVTTFAKTLTKSDSYSGGSFSVRRTCAETIFPKLDKRLKRPQQLVSARDVHGVEWTFRHVYRGTPERNLLTTGWSNFVNSKKLLIGDSVVFLREEDGTIHIGLRRAERASRWNAYGRLVRGNASRTGAAAGPSDGVVPAEDVVAAATLAAAGKPFEVVHYPRARAPAFCVRAAAVMEAMQVSWCPGLRFKMAFETELSRISWFMGTVDGVGAADPARWPQSPWRFLRVTWDEPELLPQRNVNRLSPWQVELVATMPNLPHFSPPPPRKKPRTPPYTEYQSEGRQLFDPVFQRNNPLPLPLLHHPAPTHDRNRHGFVPSFPFPDSIAAAAAGMQGARQPQFAPFFSHYLSNLWRSLLLGGIRRPGDRHAPPAPRIATDVKNSSPTPRSPSPVAKKGDGVKPPGIMLFGRAILTEEEMKSSNSSGISTSPPATESGSSKPDRDDEKVTHASPADKNLPSWRSSCSGDSSASEFGLEPGQCKVFVELDAFVRSALQAE